MNEERLNSNRETMILSSLKSELITNLQELKIDYEKNLTFYQATVNVYDFIQKKSIEVDSMYKDFSNCVKFTKFFPKTSTYETLIPGNLEIIRSDSLKEIITDIMSMDLKES